MATAGGASTTGLVAGTGGLGTAGATHDPSLFTWPESNADGGVALSCKPGHYVGTYSCDIKVPREFTPFLVGDAGLVFPASGVVDLVLDQGQNGEFLSVSGGKLTSNVAAFALTATVVGQLSCQTGVFSGQLTNGQVSIPPFPPGATFTGSLGAAFDRGQDELRGTWNLIGDQTFHGAMCTGPWNATFQGP